MSTLVDHQGDKPHKSATHKIVGVRVWFGQYNGERFFIINGDGGILSSYSEHYLKRSGYEIIPLKTLEELMEEYLSEKA